MNDAIYQYAMETAKQRALTQWQTRNFNMWITPPTPATPGTLNENWIDPWYENELGSNTNQEPTYEIMVNAYFAYCWLKNHGYSKYAMCGMISTLRHESSISGGNWEGGYHPYEGRQFGSGFRAFNPTDTNSNYNSKTWYTTSGTIEPAYEIIVTDEDTGVDWPLVAPAGSWLAVKKYPYKRDPDTQKPIIPPRWDTSGIPNGYKGQGGGYGLVQWTAWTKLINLAAMVYPTYGAIHWQLNPTLQFEVIEKQRALSKQGDTSNGEWINSNGAQAGFKLTQNSHMFTYNQPMTWENWANDSWLSWVDNTCNLANITNPLDRAWARRMTGLEFWSKCYEKGGDYDYNSINFRAITLDTFDAITYWDSHGGGSLLDVPRARDIPEDAELDALHRKFDTMSAILCVKRRKKKNVRTILF